MIRLRCPVWECLTTWVLHPEAVDERIASVAEHVQSAHGWDHLGARTCVLQVNHEAIRKAYDELTADRPHRSPKPASRR